jgi:hypothetical protein
MGFELLTILAAEGSGQGSEPGVAGGVLIIVGSVIVLAALLAAVYALLIRRTRRERTAQGTHRAGPGRSSGPHAGGS